MLLGESIVPYRVFRAFEAFAGRRKGEVLDAEAAANRGIDGLMAGCEGRGAWDENQSSSMGLASNSNYRKV